MVNLVSFKHDIKLGKRGEQEVKNLLEKSGFTIEEVDKQNRIAYDIRIVLKTHNIDTTIEVKFDRLAESTGNFCLEYFNPKLNKPSGINATSSLLYIYIIPDGSNLPIWATSVKLLKKYIRDNPPLKDLKRVGDGNSSIYLYRLDEILKIFVRLDNISIDLIPDKIKWLLKGKGGPKSSPPKDL